MKNSVSGALPAPRPWPFMAMVQRGDITLDAAVRVWTNRPHGKSWMSQRLVTEYLADLKRRQAEGRAAIAAAVNTLISQYQH